MNKDDVELFGAMSLYGGSFAAALAKAAFRADDENLARIKRAFPELIEQYAGMVRRLSEMEASV